MCSNVDLIGLVVAHLWAVVPNYRVYLVLPDTHQTLLGSTVVRGLATEALYGGLVYLYIRAT